MTVLAPYDGSSLSETAVQRAVGFGEYRDEAVVVLTVVPDDPAFAERRGWIEAGESYDPDAVERQFRSELDGIAPTATVRTERPTEPAARGATTRNDVTRTIRRVAADVDATVLFIGSENAAQVPAPADSVGTPIAGDADYDVHIVRTAD